MAAVRFANNLRDERGGSQKCSIVLVDDGKETQDIPSCLIETWNKHLPINKKQIRPAADSADDDNQKLTRDQDGQLKLFRCIDENGTIRIEEVKPGPLFRSDLESEVIILLLSLCFNCSKIHFFFKNAFIIDNGPFQIYIWIGRRSSENERKFAARNAEMFAKKKNYPTGINIARVVEGAESAQFKAMFAKWPDPTSAGMVQPYRFNKIAKPTQSSSFNAAKLHDERKLAAESFMVDDGTGSVEVFRVERQQIDESNVTYVMVEQTSDSEHLPGMFYGGDCYIIVYRYNVYGSTKAIIYYWLVSHASMIFEIFK